MNSALTPDQSSLRDGMLAALGEICPPSVVRNPDASFARALAGTGVYGTIVPVESGGLGLGVLEGIVVLEACGRFAVPAPVVETMLVAAPALADRGEARLASVLEGSTQLEASEFECAEGSAGWIRSALGTAAFQVGLADRMLEMGVEYAKVREQFGRPVGSFQAVKHHLANAAIRVEFARPLVYRAGWSLDQGDVRAPVHVSMAKIRADEAVLFVARTVLQTHGAIGYTTEHDLHLWMNRAWSLARAWGHATTHREILSTFLRCTPDLWEYPHG